LAQAILAQTILVNSPHSSLDLPQAKGRTAMSRILSLALCYLAAASDPVLDAIPRDPPLRQLRGETRAAASEDSPAKDRQEPKAVSEGEGDDEFDGETEAVENACVDQPGWNTDFSNRMYDCAIQNGGNAKKDGTCMAEKQGVSRDCGRCMERLMRCSVKCAAEYKCSLLLMGRMKKGKCNKCVRSRCASSFKKCAGVADPQGASLRLLV